MCQSKCTGCYEITREVFYLNKLSIYCSTNSHMGACEQTHLTSASLLSMLCCKQDLLMCQLLTYVPITS